MRNKLKVRLTIAMAAILISVFGVQSTKAQDAGSSNMVFSPYTMYGIGDLIPKGSASTMSMGGVGLGMRSMFEINHLNPASLSGMVRNSALFSFGARGNNFYSKTPYGKTAYNNFDISDMGIALPIYRGIGLSFSLNPVSAVGYSSTVIDSTSRVVENIGHAQYDYTGNGGISQVSMGVGVMIVRGFSIGAKANYSFGNINREFNTTILPMLGQTTPYKSVISSNNTHISHFTFDIGAQYSIRTSKQSDLTLGVTYQPGTNIQAPRTDELYVVGSQSVDTLEFKSYKYNIDIPQKLSAGLYYKLLHNNFERLTIGFDWSRQDWSNAFEMNTVQKISLKDQTDYKFGISYTPDRFNLNSLFKRWTYKAGFHYSESYLMKDNVSLKDMGVSFGVDVPLRRDNNFVSKATFGVDFGKRGTYQVGQVQDKYFKIYVGLSLFSLDFGDAWFHKIKFM